MIKFLILLLFPVQLFAQVEFMGYVEHNKIIFDNSKIWELFKRHPEINGSNKGNKIYVPEIKEYPKGKYKRIDIEGFVTLYNTQFDLALTHDVEIVSPVKVTYIEYDLKTKKGKPVNRNNDNDDYNRPDNLKEKVREKDYRQFEKKWIKESQKIEKFILENNFIWLKTKQGTITLYDKNNKLWFIITNKWQSFKILENEIDLLLDQIKKYYIAGNLLIKYAKKSIQISPIK